MKQRMFVIAALGTAALGGSAEAGFLGFVAAAKQSGTNVLVDVFAAVGNSSDKGLNVFNANITTTNPGGFYQAPGLNTRCWAPDCLGFTSTRDSIDSFLTIGTYSGGAYGGQYYAACNTSPDPSFPSDGWNPPVGPATCNSVPPNAGWYNGDPTSVDTTPELLNFAGYGRVDSGPTASNGSCPASVGSVGATRGIWVAHLVLANASISSYRINWSACMSIKDGMTGAVDQRISTFVIPAPGAIALLGIGGIAVRRRRG